MPSLQKRMPAFGALMITVSIAALSGCVSDKKALDSAAVVDPAAATAVAATTAAPAQQQANPQTGYQDPMVNNVSGAAPQLVAGDPGQAQMQAQQMAPGTAAVGPANIGGLAMQSTRINAHTTSIFSSQNNAAAAPLGADVNAYAPTQPQIMPGVSSVYSTPQAPAVIIPPTPATTPQQHSSENTAAPQAAVQQAALVPGSIPPATMNALYSAPKQNLLSGLSALLHKASLPGMTRVAPNGLKIQTDRVEVGCFQPQLVSMIKSVENHFGQPVVVTSGYRDPEHNREVGGAEESLHKSCAAADIQVNGVSKWDVASYVRSLPGRGGVGTYCHTDSIHIDTGNSRDWNWGCGGRGNKNITARAI